MITNFLQHNPAQANQESDVAYGGDSLRNSGIGVNAIVPSAWLNKVLYQTTTFVVAFCNALIEKGYSTSDSDLTALTAVLAQVADLNDISVESNARGAADNTLQNNINAEASTRAGAIGAEATSRANADSAEATARSSADTTLQSNLNAEASTRSSADTNLQAQVTAINTPPQTASTSGHVALPGGMILQWFPAVTVSEAGDSVHAVTFPYPFPNNCFSVQVTTVTGQGGPGSSGDTDVHTMQLTGTPTSTGCSIRHSVGGVYTVSQTITAIVFAVGN